MGRGLLVAVGLEGVASVLWRGRSARRPHSAGGAQAGGGVPATPPRRAEGRAPVRGEKGRGARAAGRVLRPPARTLPVTAGRRAFPVVPALL